MNINIEFCISQLVLVVPKFTLNGQIGVFKASFLKHGTSVLSQKKVKIKQNWTRPENLGICFCVSFDRYCQKLIFRGETERQPVSLPKFEIFFSFPNFAKHEKQYLQKTVKFGIFHNSFCLYFHLKLYKVFEVIKNVKVLKFKEDWDEL